jgi:dTDP-4-dehydrorhamnose 3,5-epimerase
MKITKTAISDVLILEPEVIADDRGLFFESFNTKIFDGLGIKNEFVQDNHSRSLKNVLRGLHYQIRQPQGKLVRVIAGEVYDVAVDLRRNSPSFSKWVGATLSGENRLIMWIPVGFAHGFLVKSNSAEVAYKVTDYYAPEFERTIAWNDSDLGIEWPLEGEPVLSARDKLGSRFCTAETF